MRGTYNLLEAARLAPTVERVVVASSDKAYGEHEVLPYREDAKLQPRLWALSTLVRKHADKRRPYK